MKTIIKYALSVTLSALFCVNSMASSVTLLDISGPDTDFIAIDNGESAGISFTLDQTFADIVITPDVFCLGCTGRFVLMQNEVGSSASLSNLVYAEEFSGGQATALNFTGSLEAATYFLIFIVDSGEAGWLSDDNATIYTASDVAAGISIFSNTSNTDITFPGASNFSALFGTDAYITVEGTLVPVPLPAALFLFSSALLGLFSTACKSD